MISKLGPWWPSAGATQLAGVLSLVGGCSVGTGCSYKSQVTKEVVEEKVLPAHSISLCLVTL